MNIDVAENGSLSVEKAAFLLAECLRKQKNWPKIDFDVAVIIYDWLQTCSDLSLEAVQSTIVAQLKAQIDEQCKRMRNLEEAFIEKLEYANRLEAKLKSNSKLPLKSDLEEEDEMDLLPLIKRFRESNRLLGVIKTNHLSDEADHQQNWSTPSEPMSQSQSQTKFDRDVMQWDTETICDWMQNLRLRHEHIARAQLMRIDGRQLIAMSLHDLEKDFNVKNVFDRKKLFYAIQALKNSSDPCLKNALELDTNWALRWLDDIGLPQYKKQFSSNSIDGCLVHFLTYDDLAELGVTSALHLASLQTGIQILRAHAFDPNVFKRRSLPTDSTNPNADEICLWTTHRVMDWLHSIDLAEFASNLRGSGVHGALLVHEPRFNENLLARILTISNDKTLLKRHLTTHFNRLLGPDIVYAKREAELSLMTLTLTGKIKVCKKSQFSLKRQKKRQYDFVENLICPLDKKSTEDLSTTDN